MCIGRRASIAAWPTPTGSRSPPRLVSRPLAGVADVEVVGGGVTGCSCALTLAQAGKRVRLHEAREVASGASGRNGGFALRGGAMAYDSARDWLGAEQAAESWRLTEALRRPDGRARRRCVPPHGQPAARGRRRARRASRGVRGAARGRLRRRLARRAARAARRPFPGALFHPDDAVLQPARLVRRLAVSPPRRAPRSASTIGSRILDALDADDVVIATDGYPSGLLGELEGLIIPTRGQMIATEPIPERLFPMPHYGRHGYDYWHQDEEGRILAGGFRDFDLESEFTTSRRRRRGSRAHSTTSSSRFSAGGPW